MATTDNDTVNRIGLICDAIADAEALGWRNRNGVCVSLFWYELADDNDGIPGVLERPRHRGVGAVADPVHVEDGVVADVTTPDGPTGEVGLTHLATTQRPGEQPAAGNMEGTQDSRGDRT